MPPSRPLVIVTRRLPAAVEEALAASFQVRLNPDDRQYTGSQLREALGQADGVLCTLTDGLDAGVIAGGAVRTRILANFGVGTNHIDLAAAGAAGIVVSNTPGVLTECTADLTLALMLMVLRRLGEGERELRAGAWSGWHPTHLLGRRLSGKTLGVIGFGRIGQAVARRAHHGFGMRVLAHGRGPIPADRLATGGAVAEPDLDALLGRADVVSLHVPLLPDTRHLLDARRIALMPPHAVLINTARGEIVDEAAVAAALHAGTLGGAGLDVFEREPRLHPGLLTAPRTVLLPHLGSATQETRTAMGMRAVENLRAFFSGAAPPDRVA
jgi:glyoxylate reductase